MRTPSLVVPIALLCVSLQDPRGKTIKRAPPPVDPPPLSQVNDPFMTPVERKDLFQRYAGQNALEGFYVLKRIVTQGQPRYPESEGYLVLGRRHLSLHIRYVDGGQVVSVESAFRRYAFTGDTLTMYSLIGHSDLPGDEVQLEKRGTPHRRSVRVIGGTLRVQRTEQDYLEFIRLE